MFDNISLLGSSMLWSNPSSIQNPVNPAILNFMQPIDFNQFGKNTDAFSNKISGCGMYVIDPKKCESQFSPIIERIAKEYGVDPKVVKAMIKQESNFNPNAVSHCGAKGLMQLMPGTAKDMGVKDVFDPEQNIRGGIKYLAMLLKRYGGDYRKAVAAYNGGMGNIDRKGINFCTETSNYHKKILGDYA